MTEVGVFEKRGEGIHYMELKEGRCCATNACNLNLDESITWSWKFTLATTDLAAEMKSRIHYMELKEPLPPSPAPRGLPNPLHGVESPRW